MPGFSSPPPKRQKMSDAQSERRALMQSIVAAVHVVSVPADHVRIVPRRYCNRRHTPGHVVCGDRCFQEYCLRIVGTNILRSFFKTEHRSGSPARCALVYRTWIRSHVDPETNALEGLIQLCPTGRDAPGRLAPTSTLLVVAMHPRTFLRRKNTEFVGVKITRVCDHMAPFVEENVLEAIAIQSDRMQHARAMMNLRL